MFFGHSSSSVAWTRPLLPMFFGHSSSSVARAAAVARSQLSPSSAARLQHRLRLVPNFDSSSPPAGPRDLGCNIPLSPPPARHFSRLAAPCLNNHRNQQQKFQKAGSSKILMCFSKINHQFEQKMCRRPLVVAKNISDSSKNKCQFQQYKSQVPAKNVSLPVGLKQKISLIPAKTNAHSSKTYKGYQQNLQRVPAKMTQLLFVSEPIRPRRLLLALVIVGGSFPCRRFQHRQVPDRKSVV